jgi:hypothetical protein
MEPSTLYFRKLPIILMICALPQSNTARSAEIDTAMKVADVPALTKNLADSQAEVLKTIQTSSNPEDALAKQYSDLQSLCTAKFDQLVKDQKRYATAEARTNVIGSLLALLGSVTAYAPGKTVLMGLGISSSGSGTVSSGVTQFFSKRSTTDAASLAILQGQLAGIFDRYELVDPGSDPKGTRRSAILSRGTNICLGLTPATESADPPAQSASS